MSTRRLRVLPLLNLFGALLSVDAALAGGLYHPDDFGQRWNIRFTVTPVLPSLIKNPR